MVASSGPQVVPTGASRRLRGTATARHAHAAAPTDAATPTYSAPARPRADGPTVLVGSHSQVRYRWGCRLCMGGGNGSDGTFHARPASSRHLSRRALPVPWVPLVPWVLTVLPVPVLPSGLSVRLDGCTPRLGSRRPSLRSSFHTRLGSEPKRLHARLRRRYSRTQAKWRRLVMHPTDDKTNPRQSLDVNGSTLTARCRIQGLPGH